MRGFRDSRRHFLLLALASVMAIAALTESMRVYLGARASKMFLAPMIGVMEPCILAQQPTGTSAPDDGLASCTGPDGSASKLVEATLSALAPPGARSRWELGYTLQVPLLKLLKGSGSEWIVDDDAVGRLVRTIRDTERPVIVYLFSTHFAANAPIEEALQANPENLSATREGPLPRDKYYGTDIFNWSFATTSNGITQRRLQAVQAIVGGICRLEPRQIAKIRGVTLLGELHHLFPDFQGGMGFAMPYLVSDYSEASKLGFRKYLKKKYDSIEQLNAVLGTRWSSFDEVEPPSKDIRTMPLRDFTEHMDSFAHGSLPIAGWAYVKGPPAQSPPVVRVYRDGELIGKTTASLGRQDVLQAMPELGDANTGWRINMDFRALPVGLHRIDVFLESGPDEGLVHLGTRQIAIMDRQQGTPRPAPQKPLPPSHEPTDMVKAHVDLPLDQSSYFYNPLAPLWHAFRGQQVVDYLEFFGKALKGSCLANTKLYTHQIIPFSNPGWDENKYAIDGSLQNLKGIGLGVSLYGEPTYGTSFLEWLAPTNHLTYGVTELHPLKAMQTPQFKAMLDTHAAHGAVFVSFFLEPRWNGSVVSRQRNIFSFDPENDNFGSAQLYRAVGATLAGH